MRVSQFDVACGTDQVTTGQQQGALSTRERVCADWALTKALIERLLHAPNLFLQVLADRMVGAVDE